MFESYFESDTDKSDTGTESGFNIGMEDFERMTEKKDSSFSQLFELSILDGNDGEIQSGLDLIPDYSYHWEGDLNKINPEKIVVALAKGDLQEGSTVANQLAEIYSVSTGVSDRAGAARVLWREITEGLREQRLYLDASASGGRIPPSYYLITLNDSSGNMLGDVIVAKGRGPK